MTQKLLTDSRLASLTANSILEAFEAYQTWFKLITRRAKGCFEKRDWQAGRSNAKERLNLYKQTIDELLKQIKELLGDKAQDRLVWVSVKAVYSNLISERGDWEIAETFFNSVTRQSFITVGVDEQVEFVHTDFEAPPSPTTQVIYKKYPVTQFSTATSLLEAILADYPFEREFEDLARDIQLVAARLQAHLDEHQITLQSFAGAEMLTSVFYRGKSAYLVGRLVDANDKTRYPLALALINYPNGLTIDAVLLEEDEVSILFSFTRSYFQVEVERPFDLVCFLKSIMPRKKTAEHYISIGYNKHGKTEMYRDLLHHLATTPEQFIVARGEPGMVMAVFTLPSFDMVFKVIKDVFAYPKNATRGEVMEQYRMVYRHDRAGRLVDAQEFEHLQFERQRFAPELLAQLEKVASKSVTVHADYVILNHVYLERRVVPLNLYIREAEENLAIAAVVDMGHTIKDLAATNVFTGDMLLKNFGVTRHGRVVFYDYDELTRLTSCDFRLMPKASSYDEEISDQPWFSVGKDDVFPEEFKYFIGLTGKLREAFLEHHADLFEVAFWNGLKERLQGGEVLDIYPYEQQKRLLPQNYSAAD